MSFTQLMALTVVGTTQMLRSSRESIELDDLAERLDELERRGDDAGV